MAISNTAQRNHDAMFPGHRSMLTVTDPELLGTSQRNSMAPYSTRAVWVFEETSASKPN